MSNLSDRLLGLAGLVLAAFMVWGAFLIPTSFIQDPLGPKAFPLIVAAVITLASLAIIARPDPEPEWPRLGRFLEVAVATGVMIAYAQFLPVAGFIASTSIAAAFLSWRLGTPPLKALFAGVLIAVGIYLVFHTILGLALARGPWGF